MSHKNCIPCLFLTAGLQDGTSKEGAGRVALFKETGLLHLYTVEVRVWASLTT